MTPNVPCTACQLRGDWSADAYITCGLPGDLDIVLLASIDDSFFI